MRLSLFLPPLLSLALVALLVGCRSAPPPPPPPPSRPAKGLWEWRADGKPITGLRVSVDEQLLRIYSGTEEVGVSYIASGLRSFPTPIGEFRVLEKVADKVSNLYGKSYDAQGKLVNSDFKQGRDLLPPGGRFEPAKMTYFLRLSNDGLGLHVGPIPSPGRRASHGCIRMPQSFAAKLFRATALGTPVSIAGNGPDYASYLKQSQLRTRENAAKLAAAQLKAQEAAAEMRAATGLSANDPNGPATAVGGPTAAPAAAGIAPASPSGAAPAASGASPSGAPLAPPAR